MKKLIAFYLLAAFSAHAENQTDLKKVEEARRAWARKHFEEQGLPMPDGGVQLVDANKMSSYRELHEVRQRQKAQVMKLGYVNEMHPNYTNLVRAGEITPDTLTYNSANYGPESEEMHKKLSEIKMAYNFTQVPVSPDIKVIGFSPYLTYIENKGWIGAAEFFKLDDVGACYYSENNLKLSHGSVVIAKEDATYEINKKVTTISIAGQAGKGFVYNIAWYDNKFFKELECASPTYSEGIKDKLITLAKKIDKQKK